MALNGIQIFKLTPKKNCKECGCPTCMAFSYLNESLPYMNTTAENMVFWIFQTTSEYLSEERELRLEYVRLYETPTAFAEFRREWLDD